MASAFHEVRFPTDISYGSNFGPGYSTDIVTMSGGSEQRNIGWSQAKCKGNVAHGVRTQDQFDRLLAFFRTKKGKAIGFRFKDWSDFTAYGQQLGIGDGNNRNFQMLKEYVDEEGNKEIRKITKPVRGSVIVYLNGILTSEYSIDYSKGIIIFNNAPLQGVVVTTDFEFDVPVRFDTDEMPTSFQAWKVFGWSSIPIVEVRV